MPSPILPSDFDIQNFSGDVCERLRKLLELNDTLKTFFSWFLNSDGTVSDAFKAEIQDVAVAVGAVIFNPVNSVPAGYLIANGGAVSRATYANLFAVYGTTFGTGNGSTTFNLPNLLGTFLKGAGPAGSNPVGTTGGASTITLTEAQIPSHTHPFPAGDDASGFLLKTSVSGKALDVVGSGDAIQVPATGATGGGQSHENEPPFYSGYWLVKY